MLKNLSLSLKLALLPAIAVLGLLLFVGFATSQLSNNDQRLNTLEQDNYPTLEKADAAIFKYSPVVASSDRRTGLSGVGCCLILVSVSFMVSGPVLEYHGEYH